MTKTELESKHIAELHALAAEAKVPRYRMLRREELIEKLSDGEGGASRAGGSPGEKPSRERPRSSRPRRERGGGGGRERRPRERQERADREEREERPAREERSDRDERPRRGERVAAEEVAEPEARREAAPAPAPAAEAPAPKRRRRRRRFGRRSKSLRVSDLLTPPPGRQSLVYGEGRVGCTALLREIAAELGEGSIALLIDPSPEELADWKREAPEAELVVAAQARHASDALAQARRRAEGGENVTLLVDSLTRLEDVETAKEVFDGGLGLTSSGSLTVVAALERLP
ncbi:MAG TPA: Rho termination factor N-terminal domain-containing protein [Solirubrobacterales bacterium]|nr:Rho termination factor N-terminal domain-containing protein [Solirubrobacterales bacterium]